MATYFDEYQALDTVPAQKARLYQFVGDNADKIKMTPEEQYRFNWGQDAVSEDWIKAKASEIQKQIEGANSTSILRRGLGKGETVEKVDDPKEESETDGTQIDPVTGLPKTEKSDGYGGDSNPGSVSGKTGIGVGSLSDARDNAAKNAALGTLGFGDVVGIAKTGPIGLAKTGFDAYRAYQGVVDRTNQATLDRVNATEDPIAELAYEQGWTTRPDPIDGYGGDNSNRSDPGATGSMGDTDND